MKFIRKITKKEDQTLTSKDAAKERLHLVLMQDRANVSADFLELMKQEIIEVIKKYIDVDETSIDVRLTNKDNGDGTKGAPALYANIPIINIKEEVRQNSKTSTPENTKDVSENIIKTKESEAENQQQDVIDESNTTPENKEDTENVEEIVHEEKQDEKIATQNIEN